MRNGSQEVTRNLVNTCLRAIYMPWYGLASASLILAVALIALGSGACSGPAKPVAVTWQSMGTFAEVMAAADEQSALDGATAGAKKRLESLEARLSIFQPVSEISNLNRSAGKSSVRLSRETAEVLGLALRYAEGSGGAFDPTVGQLVRFWGFNKGSPPASLPNQEEIATVLQRVGYCHLIVSNGAAFLDREGMEVDLGGIAKGYAVDVCWREMAANKVKNFMVNLGGNIRCRGTAESGRAWSVGVKDPFDRDRNIGAIRLADGMAVATSGNYEKFVEIGGKRYSHIVDPRTGRPVEGVASVTVIATNAVEADAMSTAIFVLGMKDAKPVLSRMPDCHVIFIPDTQPMKVYVSPGARKYFMAGPELAGEVGDM